MNQRECVMCRRKDSASVKVRMPGTQEGHYFVCNREQISLYDQLYIGFLAPRGVSSEHARI
jgi:hypothetical protein